MKEEKENNKYYNSKMQERSTKTGEFVCSYFNWIPLEKQKEKVEELENITKKDENK